MHMSILCCFYFLTGSDSQEASFLFFFLFLKVISHYLALDGLSLTGIIETETTWAIRPLKFYPGWG